MVETVHIELSRLSKNYEKTPALDDISLVIEPGQVVTIIGLNGAGKTTLLRCLAGIAAPTRGQVLYDGEGFRRARLDLRKRLMFLPDVPPIYGDMNALQHVALMARLYDRDTSGMTEPLLKVLTELDLLPLAEAPVCTLSRGQHYKAALAALALIDPELWLLDEPFASGLDPQGLAMLKEYARAATARGRTVIYSTQILEIAERFSDRLCVLDHGKLRHVYAKADLEMMPNQGPDSLESRLREFREIPS